MIDPVRIQRQVCMTLWASLWALAVLSAGAQLSAAGKNATVPPDVQALLAKADNFRVPFREGRVRVELLALEDGRVTGRSDFEVLQSADGASRVEMLDARVRGQRALLSDQGLWLYVPASRRAIRLTPLQRLMGNANYGDIGRMRLTDDYRVARAEPAVDRPGVWVLHLEACSATAVYPEVEMLVEEKTGRPLMADFYVASGKLLKSAEYDPPVELDGREVIAAITFTSGSDDGKRTRMVMEAFREQALPEHLFTVSGLAK